MFKFKKHAEKGDVVNLPQFDGHSKKCTICTKGVSHEKKSTFYERV
jgi:hypothetical protein